jgi:hypothetical protein
MHGTTELSSHSTPRELQTLCKRLPCLYEKCLAGSLHFALSLVMVGCREFAICGAFCLPRRGKSGTWSWGRKESREGGRLGSGPEQRREAAKRDGPKETELEAAPHQEEGFLARAAAGGAPERSPNPALGSLDRPSVVSLAATHQVTRPSRLLSPPASPSYTQPLLSISLSSLFFFNTQVIPFLFFSGACYVLSACSCPCSCFFYVLFVSRRITRVHYAYHQRNHGFYQYSRWPARRV